MANVYAPMTIINYIAYKSEHSLSRIKNAQYYYIYTTIFQDIIKASIAMYIIDLSRNSIKEREANSSLYVFLKNWLINLDQGKINLKHSPIWFSIQLAEYLGFKINNNMSPENIYFDLMNGEYIDNDVRHNHIMSEYYSKVLYNYINNTNLDLIDKDDRNKLLDRLLEYYQLHIEGFRRLKSVDVIRKILS